MLYNCSESPPPILGEKLPSMIPYWRRIPHNGFESDYKDQFDFVMNIDITWDYMAFISENW